MMENGDARHFVIHYLLGYASTIIKAVAEDRVNVGTKTIAEEWLEKYGRFDRSEIARNKEASS